MANVKISEMVDVWSNGGTIFNGIKMDVTDTASSASSKLINMQIGSSDVFTVDKSGNIVTTGSATVAGITSSGDVVPDADNAHDLGSASKEWRNIYIDGTANIDSLVADTADINGGTIDGVTIGGSSAAALTCTTFTSTGIDDNATSTQVTVNDTGVGFGVTNPDTTVHAHNTGLSVFTGTLDGTAKLSHDYTGSAWASLDFTHNNGNPSGRIGVSSTGSGTKMSFGTSNIYASGVTNEAMTIDHNGNVGIGGAPSHKLDVQGSVDSGAIIGRIFNTSTTSSSAILNIASGTKFTNFNVNYAGQFLDESGNLTTRYSSYDAHYWRNTAASELMRLNSTGLGIGGAPSYKLEVFGTSNLGGAFRLSTYGAGTLTTDASGNVTASSDERLKENITPYSAGLEEIKQINPISYNWNRRSGMDRMNTYHGVSAQNVEAAIPEAIGVDVDGYKAVQDRPLIAALINAVKTLEARVAELEAA